MKAFNKSSLLTDRRSWLKRRGVALSLTIAISFALVVAIGVLVAGQGAISFIKHHLASKSTFWIYSILFLRWIVS